MDKNQLDTGLAALQAAAEAGNPQARQKALMAKASSGTITPEENDELIKSLGGGNELATAAVAGLQTDTIQKSIDVSDYLREQHDGLVAGLSAIADHITKSEADDQRFRVALATSVMDLATMVKSQGEQLAQLLGTPASPPKSQGVNAPAEGRVIEKGFGGQPPQQNQLNKSQVLDIMEAISADPNQGTQGFAKCGENMSVAIAKYETGTEISKALAIEVKEYHLKQKQAA